MVIIFVFAGTFMFSNDFSNITKIEYEKYNYSEGKFGEVIIIENNHSISQLTKILNKANHQNNMYEKTKHEDFKITLYYEDDTSEIIRVWKDFGQDYDLLESATRVGTYKLKNKKSRKALYNILNLQGKE